MQDLTPQYWFIQSSYRLWDLKKYVTDLLTQKNTKGVIFQTKKYVTDLLTQKNTEGVIFQIKKNVGPSRHVYCKYPPGVRVKL